MKANELRIGNAFKQPNDERIYFVMAIMEDQVAYAKADFPDDYWYFDLDHIQPIPLTPEILEQCGFVKVQNSLKGLYIFPNYSVNAYSLYYYPKTLQIAEDTLRASWIVNCQYLHQLQNLYFALTGDELEVNLTPATAAH